MKLQGMAGKGSGKLGSMVYANVRGAQIVRQYNPVVYNPNTEKQNVQRARFSLLTKTAAMVSSSLMFQNRGPLVTNRNAFIKANFGKFGESGTSLKFDELALTGSNIDDAVYPVVTVDGQTRQMTISITDETERLAGFGYAVVCIPDQYETDVWIRSSIVSASGSSEVSVSVQLPQTDNISSVVVIGYPMMFKDSATKVSYGEQIRGEYASNDVTLSVLYNRLAGQGDILVYATKELVKTV